MKLRSGLEIPAGKTADLCRRYGVEELAIKEARAIYLG